MIRSIGALALCVLAIPGMTQDSNKEADIKALAEERLGHYVSLLGVDDTQGKAMLEHFVEGEGAVVRTRQECAMKAAEMGRAAQRHLEQGGADDDPEMTRAIMHLKEECMEVQARIEKGLEIHVAAAHRLLTEDQLRRMKSLQLTREWNPGPDCCRPVVIPSDAKPAVIDRSKGCCSWVNVEERDRARMEAKMRSVEDPGKGQDRIEEGKKVVPKESTRRPQRGEPGVTLTPQDPPSLTAP